MNRSRYVPQYSLNPYHPQQYGVPTGSPMPGMMPGQPMNMSPSAYGSPQPSMGMGNSPIQNSLSPNTMWTPNFAGPIIEDLCAPPPPTHFGAPPHASPPLNALPPRMAMSQMHPSAMPQIQNVYGMRQQMPQHHHQQFMQQQQQHHQGQMQQGMQRVMMGSYPPYGLPQPMQQPQYHHPQQQQQQGFAFEQRGFDLMPGAGMPGGPRLETGFPSAVQGNVVGVNGGVMQGQTGGSPHIGGSPGGDGGMGQQPLSPVGEALRGFLSNDLGELGH